MFTPARWKRIIHGLVWSVEGKGTVVLQPSLQEEAFRHKAESDTQTIRAG